VHNIIFLIMHQRRGVVEICFSTTQSGRQRSQTMREVPFNSQRRGDAHQIYIYHTPINALTEESINHTLRLSAVNPERDNVLPCCRTSANVSGINGANINYVHLISLLLERAATANKSYMLYLSGVLCIIGTNMQTFINRS